MLDTLKALDAQVKSFSSTFWKEWEPHLAFFGAVIWLGYLHTHGKPFDTVVEMIILVGAGGPEIRDMVVEIIKAWKGEPKA